MKPDLKKILLSIALLGFFVISQGAIPTGYYYYARGKSKEELKTTLHEISSPLYLLSYGSGVGYTWEGFYKTDRNPDNTVVDMYSDITRSFSTSSTYSSIPNMAIEHSFPKSWWGGYENFAYKDLFHLYPSDSYTNGIKGNLPLGEVVFTPTFDNGKSKVGQNGFGDFYFDNCFEPADEYKGDFARSYMYVATIYENLSNLWNSPMLTNTTYPVWKPWAIDLLLKWHAQDPVSSKEIQRNEAVYAIQGNRNPFIDHPELADYIWGKDTLKTFDYPAETGAFLISPRRRFQFDFGPIFLNATKTMTFKLQGVNISSPVTISLARNNPYIQISATNVHESQVVIGQTLEVKITPLSAGQYSDTILIQGGGLTEITKIPIRFASTSDFVVTEPTDVTPIGGTLNWLEDPNATDYKVTLYQGDTKAGDVIISGYYEGASNDKALELYNGTGGTVDLSKYSLKKQTNGAGDFVVTQQLSGSLPHNQTYVKVYSASSNVDLRAKAAVLSDSLAAFNGNDAIILLRDGMQIDAVGEVDGGADYYWGENKILKRKIDITHPTSHFELGEWDEFPYENNLNLIGNHSMSFSKSIYYILNDVSVGATNHYSVEILDPAQRYLYRVTSSSGNIMTPSVNSMLLKTKPLEIPTTLEAKDVSSSSFTANWEEDSYATGYYLDIYRLDGQVISETEGFDMVSGTTGKPLPEGWSGTASGSYTSSISSWTSPPSIALKNDGEWLQTKNYPGIINQLDFTYKYQTGGTGSYLKVEMRNNSVWERIDSIPFVNNSAAIKSYDFPGDKNYSAVKFTYKKVSGNLALDNVSINHGKQDTIFIHKNIYTTSNQFQINDLTESGVYYYQVRSTKGSYISDSSEAMSVLTVSSGMNSNFNNKYQFYTLNDGFVIKGLNGQESIRIYTLTGALIKEFHPADNEQFIPLNEKGVFVIQVSDDTGTVSYKVVK